MFALLMAIAHAATISKTVTFELNQTAPSSSIPSAQVVEVSAFYGYDDSLPDIVIASSWSYLTCNVWDGNLRATFKATRGTWPGSWPSSATCTFDVGPNTVVVTVALVSCTSAVCDRHDFDHSAGTANCPIASVSMAQFAVVSCRMPAPPSGKIYALPNNARRLREYADLSWPAQYKVGASANPDTDPRVTAVQCQLATWDAPSGPDPYDLTVTVTDALRSDTTVYCPIRLQTTATKAFSWGTEQVVTVDRP